VRETFDEERQVFMTDLVRKHPTIVSDLGKDIIRNNLVPNIPVKCIHWFLRNTIFENEDESQSVDPVPATEGAAIFIKTASTFLRLLIFKVKIHSSIHSCRRRVLS